MSLERVVKSCGFESSVWENYLSYSKSIFINVFLSPKHGNVT
jgi:hypothetical protein